MAASVLFSVQDELWLQRVRALHPRARSFTNKLAGAAGTWRGAGKPLRWSQSWMEALRPAMACENPLRDRRKTGKRALIVENMLTHGMIHGQLMDILLRSAWIRCMFSSASSSELAFRIFGLLKPYEWMNEWWYSRIWWYSIEWVLWEARFPYRYIHSLSAPLPLSPSHPSSPSQHSFSPKLSQSGVRVRIRTSHIVQKLFIIALPT